MAADSACRMLLTERGISENATLRDLRAQCLFANDTRNSTYLTIPDANLWCLTLVLFPAACIFGNFLVVVAVLSERSLKTSTNFLLVSLACADLLVGTLVMPFSVYVTVNRLNWFLPNAVCNFFCVADVSASTASIVHLVAISIDRFYAVVRHMEYKSPKHKKRVYGTIMFTWMFSIGIGLPLGIGMNQSDTPDDPHRCGIVNPDYMLYMSLFAFYIPCLVMIVMYSFVFYKLHKRMRAVKLQEMAAGQMVQFGDNLGNILQHAYGHKDLRNASMGWAMPFLKTIEATIAENEDMSTEELEELTTILQTLESDPHRGIGKNMEDIPEDAENGEAGQASRAPFLAAGASLLRSTGRRLFATLFTRRRRRYKHRSKSKERDKDGQGDPGVDETTDSISYVDRTRGDSDRRRRQSLFLAKQKIKTLKDRAIELLMKLKSKQGMAIRKETRATKLVATVMMVFLVCYMPFFTLNLVKVSKLHDRTWNDNLESLFLFFTWLGYFNSCLNPVIYSLFNRKFRATFQKLLHCPVEQVESPLGRQRRLYSRPFIGDSDERKSWLMLSQKHSGTPSRMMSPRKNGAVVTAAVTTASARRTVPNPAGPSAPLSQSASVQNDPRSLRGQQKKKLRKASSASFTAMRHFKGGSLKTHSPKNAPLTEDEDGEERETQQDRSTMALSKSEPLPTIESCDDIVNIVASVNSVNAAPAAPLPANEQSTDGAGVVDFTEPVEV